MKIHGMESVCWVLKIFKVFGEPLELSMALVKRFCLLCTVGACKCIKECRNLQFMFMFKFILLQVEDSGLAHY